MSKIDDAFEQVVGLAEKFKAILDVADEVKKIGSLEQATAERVAARDIAVKANEDALADLDAVNKALADAKDAYASLLAVQKAGFEDAAMSSQAYADKIVADAKAQAQSIIDNANDQASTIEAAQTAMVVQKHSELGTINAQIANAQDELAALKAELASTSAAVDALKAAAKAVLA